jgi:phage baseplate assembly protein W
MGSFNFKSSGKKIDNRKYTNITKSMTQLVPIGLKTPLQLLQDSEDLYQTHLSPEKQLKDNIKNFLLTNHGERLGRYDYGANLSIFLYDASGSTETEYRQGIINQITNKLTSAFSGIVITDLEVDLKFNNQKIETNTTLEQTTYHTRNFITNASAAGTETASGLAKVIILLTFAIPTLNLKNQKIETTLFVGG